MQTDSMEIEYRQGDVLAGPERLIIHGCNAQGVMGSGVAKAIRDRYPWAYDAYRMAWEEDDVYLGAVIWAIDTGAARIIGNAITQEFFGRDGQKYVDDNAVRRCIQEVDRFVVLTQTEDVLIPCIGKITGVAMPMIGAGLGGGDWSVISKIIEEESKHFRPVVYSL